MLKTQPSPAAWKRCKRHKSNSTQERRRETETESRVRIYDNDPTNKISGRDTCMRAVRRRGGPGTAHRCHHSVIRRPRPIHSVGSHKPSCAKLTFYNSVIPSGWNLVWLGVPLGIHYRTHAGDFPTNAGAAGTGMPIRQLQKLSGHGDPTSRPQFILLTEPTARFRLNRGLGV